MTTLCLASQCAFIASRDIRNNIVLVNSLIDANTDGVIMMLDWAKAYDSVDHGHVENVVFCMGCDGIGLQRLMSTAKGFTLRVIGSQSVSEPFSRERGVGQGCPLAPLLFALAIEPLSRMLKQTMTGMQIDRIHVKQHTTHTRLWQCVLMTPPSLLVDLMTSLMQRKPFSVTCMHHQHPSTGKEHEKMTTVYLIANLLCVFFNRDCENVIKVYNTHKW